MCCYIVGGVLQKCCRCVVIFGIFLFSRVGVEKWYLVVIVKNFLGVFEVYGLIVVCWFWFICLQKLLYVCWKLVVYCFCQVCGNGGVLLIVLFSVLILCVILCIVMQQLVCGLVILVWMLVYDRISGLLFQDLLISLLFYLCSILVVLIWLCCMWNVFG